MKKLDLYIIRKFLGTFFFSMVLILSIVVVFDLSERLEKFIENEAPVKAIIFDYYLNFVPYFECFYYSECQQEADRVLRAIYLEKV